MNGNLCDRLTEETQWIFPFPPEPVSGDAQREYVARRLRNRSRRGLMDPVWALVLLGLLFHVIPECLAQSPAPSEYQIKAAFLYNFAKFVEWPTQAFANPGDPIIIGVLGKNVFGDDLEQTIQNKTVNNHPFLFKEFHSVTEITNCHILFISASEKEHLSKILEGLHNTSVLTVSETDEFIRAGGMINFVIENDRVHFQINDKAAKQAGLKISSKLLSLAAH